MNTTADVKKVDRVAVAHPGVDLRFHVLRFYDRESLVKHFVELGLRWEHLTPKELTGFTAQDPRARNEIHVAAIHSDDPREDIRRWAHEITHAANFALDAFLDMPQAKKEELPALCAELLADTVYLLTQGHMPAVRPESGLPSLFTP